MNFGPSTFPVTNYLPVAVLIYLYAKCGINVLLVLIGYLSLLAHLMYGKGKGKAISFQAWRVPEGSRRLRLPDFKRVGT